VATQRKRPAHKLAHRGGIQIKRIYDDPDAADGFRRWWIGSGRAASASSAPLSMTGWSISLPVPRCAGAGCELIDGEYTRVMVPGSIHP